MSSRFVSCPRCGASLLGDVFNRPDLAPCPACAARLQIAIFPALFQAHAAGSAGEAVMLDAEASCFYHPQKRAARPCENCGRFLCALCDVELNRQHLCPACLESGARKGRLVQLENHRALHDSAALTLALLPLTIILWPFAFITAPMALFLALWSWKKPSSIIPRTQARRIVAIVLASLQIVGGGLFIYYLSTH